MSATTRRNDAPYGVSDLMRVTGLGEYAVREGIKRNELPGHKVGRFYVVPAEAFRRFCNGDWTPRPHAAPTPTPEPMVTRRTG